MRKYMIANIPAMKMKSDDGLPPATWASRTWCVNTGVDSVRPLEQEES